ncbi:hypothetical protein [Pelomonas cellulosilytica]|uniref:Ig-like domain-containing protein n=1 Tax=Pelomonas cellulosilytica TaxID=2906762 RepID=A0ABS8XXL3_9BURK|nr:hypothetical protein [Pelomonas sp. P8]MCE4556552.1 hypothetical protein [Pelomonas sp. P8]
MKRLCRVMAIASLAAASLARAASVDIHPAGAEVPENLLRFELRFDRPQALPFDVERLMLLDADGQEIRHALLDVALPDADGRRITVLLDPGRVKSGVGPNLAAGRALKEGATISLRVAGRDAHEPPTVKSWRVTAAASQPLRPRQWRVRPPRSGTRDTLSVDLRTPISSVGERLIAVLDSQGRRVAGTTTLNDGDSTWRFRPSQPWTLGQHRLVTHPGLEDPAGNRQCAAFEAPLSHDETCDGASLPFTPVNLIRSVGHPAHPATS